MVTSPVICQACSAVVPSARFASVVADEARCPACGAPVPPASVNVSLQLGEPNTVINVSLDSGNINVAPEGATRSWGNDAPEPPRSRDFPFLAPPRAPDEIGWLGPYRVLGVLGTGGMGVVFRAEDPQLKRQLALKAMLPSASANPDDVTRFLREARAQAAVEHDHVAAIFQVGEDRGVPYIAMPLLKGQPLAGALRAGPRVPVAEAVRIAREMAEGLAAAHEQGLIHRDIKPGNVWLEGKQRRVKILDFGLVRVTGENAALSADSAPVTQAGFVVGTPAYMSPEQAKGDRLDPRSDLFSLGTVLYLMLTGREPFTATTITAMLIAVATDEPPAPAAVNPQVPPDLDALALRLLAKKPENRPATAEEAAALLRQIEARLAATGGPPVAAGAGPVARPAGEPWEDAEATESELRELSSAVTAPVPSARAAVEFDAPPPRRKRWVLVAAGFAFVALAALAADVVIRITNKDGSVTKIKAPEGSTVALTKDGKELAAVGPDPKKAGPAAPFDARAAAEWVLKQGGKVRVAGRAEEVGPAAALPAGPLALTGLDLTDLKGVADDDLARFAGCSTLTRLRLGHTAVGDAGLAHLKGCVALADVDLSNTKVTDAALARFKGSVRLTAVYLNSTAVGDEGLAHLAGCPALAEVWLDDTRVTNAGVAALAGCKRLHTLNVRTSGVTRPAVVALAAALPECKFGLPEGPYEYAPLTPRGAAEYVIALGGRVWVNGKLGPEDRIGKLADLPAGALALSGFDLGSTRITDADLAPLKDCKDLALLAVYDTGVGDAGLAHFKGQRRLQRLHVSATRVTDAGLAHFKDCSILSDLFVNQTAVGDAGLAHFKDCKTIRALWAKGTKVTDKGLACLGGWPGLSFVDLNDTGVGDAGVARLKNCENLTRVSLRGTKVTDKGLAVFTGREHLALLDVADTAVTGDAARGVAATLPRCHVLWSGGAVAPTQK
ncbi:protein kinase domain-containing protein [Gemmata sp.]|uniref:protein kinase domain-containing protein n=1 Tax=Gemmata sp. TaxID=1914242 RepID=UPI003F717511